MSSSKFVAVFTTYNKIYSLIKTSCKMKKATRIVLMLCFIFSGVLCFAYSKAGTVKKGDGTPIEIIEKSSHGTSDRGNSINPILNGHVLTVVFSANYGQVSIEVATTSGITVECLSVLTPNGVQVYIPNTGNYIVTFAFSDGDEYYGEFTVTD